MKNTASLTVKMPLVAPSVVHLVLASKTDIDLNYAECLLHLLSEFCYVMFLLVEIKMFTSIFSCSLLMVSATGAMFQIDCDYQDECSGTILGRQRNSFFCHFSQKVN